MRSPKTPTLQCMPWLWVCISIIDLPQALWDSTFIVWAVKFMVTEGQLSQFPSLSDSQKFDVEESDCRGFWPYPVSVSLVLRICKLISYITIYIMSRIIHLYYTFCYVLVFFSSILDFSPVFVFHNTNGIYVRISFQGSQSIYFSPFSLYYSNWMINIHLSQLHSCFSLFLFYSLTLPIDIFVLITVFLSHKISVEESHTHNLSILGVRGRKIRNSRSSLTIKQFLSQLWIYEKRPQNNKKQSQLIAILILFHEFSHYFLEHRYNNY